MSSSRTVWQEAIRPFIFRKLVNQVSADVAVIGAGITGLSTALMLQEAGKHTVVLEARRVGSGVSGTSSGCLAPMLLDVRYGDILHHFSVEATRKVLESQVEALETIAWMVGHYRIDCDFRWIDGYLYAENEAGNRLLQKELEAFGKIDLPCEKLTPGESPLPFPVERAVRVPGQARLHPLKYVHALARRVERLGGEIYEHSPVIALNHGDPYVVTTAEGSVLANDIVLATHTPIGFHPLLQSKTIPCQSYAIGFRTPIPPQDALFRDMAEPCHTLRIGEDEQGPLVILAGEDHRTGEIRETEPCFERLEEYARQRFGMTSADYRWSAPIFRSADGLPYIGSALEEPHLYVATGFSRQGLTCGTLAALLISDEILGMAGPLDKLYDPNRVKPLTTAPTLVLENLGALAHFFGDRLRRSEAADTDEIAPGEGKIMDGDSGKLAVYRDDTGEIHCLSPICSHAGCLVRWNTFEKSWDCPCHGGRYDATGHVLNGPPLSPLEPVPLPLRSRS